jgi:hypothetical protein
MSSAKELLNKYIEELDKDVKLDQFNLKEAQLALPGIKHKWSGRLVRHKIQLNELTLSRTLKLKEICTLVQMQSPTALPNTIIEKNAVKHTDIVSIDTDISYTKLIIEFLEKTEKTLSSMTFDISNVVKIIAIETT